MSAAIFIESHSGAGREKSKRDLGEEPKGKYRYDTAARILLLVWNYRDDSLCNIDGDLVPVFSAARGCMELYRYFGIYVCYRTGSGDNSEKLSDCVSGEGAHLSKFFPYNDSI